MSNASTITAITFAAVPLTGTRVTTEFAGKPIGVTGAKPGAYVTTHLYGPGRTTPETARFEGLKLPSPLAAGKYTLSVRYPDEDAAKFDFTVFPATANPPVVTPPPPVIIPKDDLPAPVVTPPAPPGTLVPWVGWPEGFSACHDLWYLVKDDCKVAKSLVSLGVTGFRVFGSGIKRGETWTSNDYDAVRTLLKACPTVTLFIRHGVDQAKRDKTKKIILPATPLTEADMHGMWGNIAKAIAGLDNRVIPELDNETNDPGYVDLGQSYGTVSAKVVAYDLLNAKIARQHLGRDRLICGSTVGGAGMVKLHVDYVKAKWEAGYYEQCQIVGDHFYTRNGAHEAEDQFGGIREIIGPDRRLDITEIGAQYQAIGDGPKNAAAYCAAARKYHARLHWYRGGQGSTPRGSDPISVLKEDGTPNREMIAELGLGRAA